MRATVMTHRGARDVSDAVHVLLEVAREEGVDLCIDPAEATRLRLTPVPGLEVCPLDEAGEVDLCVVLGGDGTILTALRECAGTGAPVLAINFGEIGFLSTVDRDELEDGIGRALAGSYEVLPMPALMIKTDGGRRIGVNDISFHRREHGRVAELEYSVQGEELGDVRCDGLVAATPVGSTGYNLANGGPVLAWGVEGFVVSFIAPHTLTARALVVAPADTLTVKNLSTRDGVDITTDGRDVGGLDPQEKIDIRFVHDQVLLAQLPGSTFYHRFREKFGRLAY
jgi:NAD+ kinase